MDARPFPPRESASGFKPQAWGGAVIPQSRAVSLEGPSEPNRRAAIGLPTHQIVRSPDLRPRAV